MNLVRVPFRKLLLFAILVVAIPLVGRGSEGASTSVALNDPLAPYQWHLKNTGQQVFSDFRPVPGIDLNLGVLHEQGVTGEGVTVGLMDSESASAMHEDLSANMIVPAGAADIGSAHATAVASIIAAAANNGKGGKGVAPQAKILDLRKVDTEPSRWPRVVNFSLGGNPPTFLPSEESDEEYAQLENPQAPLLIKSAGNSFLTITDEASRAFCTEATQDSGVGCVVANTAFASVRSIDVGAVNAAGEKASYSSAGSTVWVSGLGGEYGWQRSYAARHGAIPAIAQREPKQYFAPAILAADLPGCTAGINRTGAESRNAIDSGGASAMDPNCNYTALANGTSSAAPMVTGIVALMLQVNPRLTWRDIKYILAVTSRKIDQTRSDIIWNGIVLDRGWVSNAAGHQFSNWYGFGLVDASRAVRMASRFTSLPKLKLGSWEPYAGATVPIPYRNENKGIASIVVTDDLKIEAVLLHVETTAKSPNNLRVSLTSPLGTQSVVVPALTALQNTPDGFMIPLTASNAFLDERSRGRWKLQIIDVLDPDSERRSELVSWRLRVLGHSPL